MGERLLQAARDHGDLEHVAILHAGAPEDAAVLQKQATELFPGQLIPIVEATPAIGVHVGPQTLGIAIIACASGTTPGTPADAAAGSH